MSLSLYLQLVAFIMIGVAAYGKAAVFGSLSILGGIITCGVFLFIVALVGLIGAIKHHQVLLFFVSFSFGCIYGMCTTQHPINLQCWGK